MQHDFTGKTAIVTGGASGIGLATVKAFTSAGCAVTIADMDVDAARTIARQLAAEGRKTLAIQCDVADESAVAAMVEKTVEVFGGVDLAYNNAGIHAPVAEVSQAEGADFDRVLAVNLKGIWNCMKHELRVMQQQGSGVIVNCSSQSGVVGTAGLGAYTASKHGVIGLTKCAALENAARGIRVNCVCPGTSDTPMVADAIVRAPEHMRNLIETIPVKRLGKAEEIASAVLWLCSPGAAFVIGQAIVVDGGFCLP